MNQSIWSRIDLVPETYVDFVSLSSILFVISILITLNYKNVIKIVLYDSYKLISCTLFHNQTI